MTRLKVGTEWIFKVYEFEGGPLIREEKIFNLVTTEGLNDLLTNYFKGSTYTAAFYVGLVNNANFTAFAAGDTAAKIVTGVPGGGDNQWRESTAYAEAVRQTLTLGSATAGTISNSASVATFTINATVTLKGGFLATVSTKGGITGKLFSEAAFASLGSFVNGNVVTVQVNIVATGV